MQYRRRSYLQVLPETQTLAREQVAERKLISAVKLVRSATRASYEEAKKYVDDLETEWRAQQVPAEVQARALSLIGEGDWIGAAKQVRRETVLGLFQAKNYVDDLRTGRLRPDSAIVGRNLSAQVRAFKAAGDHDAAVALVQAEAGMSRSEAERFVSALVTDRG
jgi:ribosomal protein L7/L12